jgi:hypothetical protein
MSGEFQTMATLNSAFEICGNLASPGLAVNYNPYVDFSQRETTCDQTRIESYLDTLDLKGKRILHIGIGNSSLAERFNNRDTLIEGVTVSEKEHSHALSLGLTNYKVHLVNKYSHGFLLAFKQNQFDIIVDNNLASFACCKYHLYSMFDNYLWCLKLAGRILTDQRGMDWALLDPSLILDFAGLTELVANLPLKAIKMTPTVYALESRIMVNRDQDGQTNKIKLRVHALRRDKEQLYVESFEPELDKT